MALNTDDLINGLSRDAGGAGSNVHQRLALAFAGGAAVAAVILAVIVKVRPDVLAAFTTLLFVLKMVLVTALAGAAIMLTRAAARPEAKLPLIALAVPAALVAVGFGIEIATQPAAMLGARLIGRNWAFCLVAIPLMGILPLAGILAALSAGAPTDPARAGALAGLAAGSIAAVLYGLHCTDDSPLFVAAWYSIAIGMLMTLGHQVGKRVLAW